MGKEGFAITGFGRSGTKYLAKALGACLPGWDIRHEPRGASDESDRSDALPRILSDFRRPRYGEANSYLRFHIMDIPLEKKALILRDPLDIYLSVCNRKPPRSHPDYMGRIAGWYRTFYGWIGDGMDYFLFHETVGSRDGVSRIIDWLGQDGDMDGFDFSERVNPNKSVRYRGLSSLPRGSVQGIGILEGLSDQYHTL